MVQRLNKAEFKEKCKYSGSTYQGGMKELKKSHFSEGYNAVISKEVTVDVDLYEQFRTWRSKNRFKVRVVCQQLKNLNSPLPGRGVAALLSSLSGSTFFHFGSSSS